MTIVSASWEEELVNKAIHAPFRSVSKPIVEPDQTILEESYRYCEMITRSFSKTFYMASGLLPKAERRAIHALYAFCRSSDDIVDRGPENPLERLNTWAQESLSNHPLNHSPVSLAWADTRSRFQIPRQYAEQLLEGVATDLVKNRYTTFEELAHYCYGVASTVGLMSMHIIGFESSRAIPYAIKLGVALQLTNILRDVGEDWSNGRLYLPQEELATFGLSESDIAVGKVDNRWRKFMKFQIERTHQLYKEAIPGIAMLDKKGRFSILAAAELYRGILGDIEFHDYDVFNRRARLNNLEKGKRLPYIWWQTKKISEASI